MAIPRVLVYSHEDEPLFELDPQQLRGLVLKESINGEHSLTIDTEQELEKEQRIIVEHGGRWKEFVVTGSEERDSEDGGRSYYCAWSLQHDLSVAYIKSAKIGDAQHLHGATDAIAMVASATDRWQVGTVDSTSQSSGWFYYTSAWDALSRVVSQWAGEVDATITMSDPIRRAIDFYSEQGDQDAKRRFDYGRDLTEIQRNVLDDAFVCRIVPRGKGEQVEGSSGEPAYGRRITIESVNPTGEEWIQDDDAAMLVRLPDGSGGWEYPARIVIYEDIEEPAELLAAAQRDLHQYTRPKVGYSANVLALTGAGMDAQGVELGDAVQVVDRAFGGDGLRIEARVVGIARNLLDDYDTQLTIGNFQPSTADVIKKLERAQSSMAESVIDTDGKAEASMGIAETAQQVATAVNQHFWTDTQGAHVTEVTKDEWNDSTGPLYQSGANSLWNSLGMLFRNGLNNLLALATGDTTGVAIYNGGGNASTNVVASFTDEGAVIGADGSRQLRITDGSMLGTDDAGAQFLDISQTGAQDVVDAVKTIRFNSGRVSVQGRTLLASTVFDVSAMRPGTSSSPGDFKVRFGFTNNDIGSLDQGTFDSCSLSGHGNALFTINAGRLAFARGTAFSVTAAGTAHSIYGSASDIAVEVTIAYNPSDSTVTVDVYAENSVGSAYLYARNDARGDAWDFVYKVTAYTPSYEFGDGEATGSYAVSIGKDTKASQDNQLAMGAYNVEDTTGEHALIIGNGTSDTSRSNAFTVDWSGNVDAAGRVTGAGLTSTEEIYRTTDIDPSTAPSANKYRTVFRANDVNGAYLAYMQAFQQATDNIDGLVLNAVRVVNGASVYNGVTFGIRPDGTRTVNLSDAAVWRNALNVVGASDQSRQNARFITYSGTDQIYGLYATCINANNADFNGKDVGVIFRGGGISLYNGTDNTFPWQISGLSGTVNFSNVFTNTVAQVISAASGFTISQASYVQNGRMGQWYMTVKTTNAMSANTQYTIGTIVSGKRPATWSPVSFGDTTNTYGNGRMVAGGGVLVRPSASIAAGTTFYLLCPAYILA